MNLIAGSRTLAELLRLRDTGEYAEFITFACLTELTRLRLPLKQKQ